MDTRKMARSAIVAAVYATATIGFAPISFGMMQVRVAESLTVLPFLWPDTTVGLVLGCLVANIVGGYGLLDMGLGSVATLLAALITSRLKRETLAPLPPVVLNGLIVGAYLSHILGTPMAVTMAYVAAGQVVACYGLGLPLLRVARGIQARWK